MTKFILSFVLLVLTFSFGYVKGADDFKIGVYKNCISAKFSPTICKNYIKIIEEKEYKLTGAK